MDYTATFRENNYQVSIEVELKDNWCRKDIICNANVSDPNGFNLAGELAGSDQIDLRGFYKIEAKELQIENVQKGIIDKGQGFLVNCISEILKIEPDIEHIYLANINHSKTLSLLKELVAMGGGIESLTDEQRKPLLSALERNGYNNQEIVLEGAAFYGVRASRV